MLKISSQAKEKLLIMGGRKKISKLCQLIMNLSVIVIIQNGYFDKVNAAKLALEL